MTRLFRRTPLLSTQPIGPWPTGGVTAPSVQQAARTPENAGYRAPADGGRCPLAVFRPASYEAKYPYPLLVWLLGDGLDETAMLRLMPKVSTRNFGAIGLPASVATRQHRNDKQPHEFVNWLGEELDREADLFSAVRFARRRLHIHSERIFLIGIGKGAACALDCGLTFSDCFAGIAALDGAFPSSALQPLACLRRARRVPIFLAQRSATHEEQAAETRATRRLLHTAGFTVEAHGFDGPELAPEIFARLNRWVMAQWS